VDEALKAKEEGKEKVILLNWSGHGLMDLTAYQNYFEGRLEDIALPQEELDKAEEIFASYPPAEPQRSGKW
jgi:tryptophan synthase beta chain